VTALGQKNEKEH